MSSTTYRPRRAATSRHLPLRSLNYHLHEWGTAAASSPDRPTLVMLHGWMDVGASFQFVVDALAAAGDDTRHIVAPDWRGFGLTDSPGADSYWFPDYLGDLDALLDRLSPTGPVDLLGHSMGGNVVMSYAGVRPGRIRRLINLEGFGLPATRPEEAPQRLAQWLDQLREPASLRDYASDAEVAARLMRNNPRLAPDRAAWLAGHWARPGPDGRWRILGDPAHRRTNPVLYQVDEVLATWRGIRAPLLWVEGAETRPEQWWQGRYTRAEFGRRLAVVPDRRECVLADAGHMLHHDQPAALAVLLADFLAAPHSNRGVG
jgi:pimeloyl-ACP methyl ester carboxylesterase